MFNLLSFKRNNIEDTHFYGVIGLFNKMGTIKMIGNSKSQIFLRSLAKPIQASLANSFSMKDTALFCASHTAQSYHIKELRKLLKKFNLSEDNLKCGVHPPIAPRKTKANGAIYNNCSAKHTLMLILCKQNNWDIETYLDFEHPLQKKILDKLIMLSEYKNPIPSLDGCGAPIWAVPIENIAKAFLNLDEYIKNSMRTYPKFAGGENRLDTKIMETNPHLVAKVGAGGLLMVLNDDNCFIIKLAQDNNPQREVIASIALNQLGWLDKSLCDYSLYNLHKIKIGEYRANFNLVN